jgi:SAM-dependent methyltransferase
MPSSYHGHITDVIGLYLQAKPKTVLDVGVGFGKWGTLFREYGDVFRGRLNPTEWQTKIEGVEIFPEYKNPNYDFSYNKVHFMDIKDFVKNNTDQYDFIYAEDVIEHLEKKEALEVIHKLKEKSKQFVLSIPLTDKWPQGEVFGNVHETHLSVWEEANFEGIFNNKKIYTNPAGKLIGLFYN